MKKLSIVLGLGLLVLNAVACSNNTNNEATTPTENVANETNTQPAVQKIWQLLLVM